MAKTFSSISENQQLVVAGGQKTTLINASNANIFLFSDEVKTGIADLTYEGQQAVLNSLYSIQPGQNKSLATGTYNLAFSSPLSSLAVVLIETNS